MILKGGWARYGTRCHGGDGATELGLVLAAVVGPLCGSSPGTVWSSRESGQRPLLWGVSGSQESYCVARLTTAAARRARSDALAPLYSPRISCPPRPPLSPGCTDVLLYCRTSVHQIPAVLVQQRCLDVCAGVQQNYSSLQHVQHRLPVHQYSSLSSTSVHQGIIYNVHIPARYAP